MKMIRVYNIVCTKCRFILLHILNSPSVGLTGNPVSYLLLVTFIHLVRLIHFKRALI